MILTKTHELLGSSDSVVVDLAVVLCSITLVLVILSIVLQICILLYGDNMKNLFNKIKFFKKRQKTDVMFLTSFFNDLASVLAKMSVDKIGALIVIENKDNLTSYINIGNKVDSAFFPEFVTSIFYNHKSALHDGAMIIRN
jgi:DNA integrity scanning protein DisA with diadenylate cyclase activity